MLTGKRAGCGGCLVMLLGLFAIFLVGSYATTRDAAKALPSATPTVDPMLPLTARLDILWARSDWEGVIGALEKARATPEWNDAYAEKLAAAQINRNAARTAMPPTPAASPAPAPNTPRMGEQGVIKVSSKQALGAVSEQALDDAFDAMIKKDQYGISNMATMGKIFLIDNGTSVLVLDRGGFLGSKIKVRILEGPLAGTAGWLPSEFVIR